MPRIGKLPKFPLCRESEVGKDDGDYDFVKMAATDIAPMTPERWLSNILDALDQIADKERQERRWLASDAYAWECPEELINTVDDVVFESLRAS